MKVTKGERNVVTHPEKLAETDDAVVGMNSRFVHSKTLY